MIGQEFFNIFIVIRRDFVLSKGICNLIWSGVLVIIATPSSGGEKQLKGGMGVGVTHFTNSRRVVRD